MTNEQLTQEVLRLSEEQAKSIAEHEKIDTILNNHQSEIDVIREDIKATKTLAEDVHILAINMENMQKAQDEMNKKVDALTSKEFVKYKENKKLIKDNIINVFAGAIGTGLLALIIWFIVNFVKGGI